MTATAIPSRPPGPPPRPPQAAMKPAPPPSAGAPAAHKPKTFSVAPWTGAGEGEKILLYGPNGMGKTTLASMAPNPIFIGFDDGGRKIRNPKTGAAINAIPGVESFEDLRDALHQFDLFPKGSSLVLDTITRAEHLARDFLLRTVKTETGKAAANIEDYGYGKGYNLLLDPVLLLLADFDALVRKGVNILLLAQQGTATVANSGGIDYLEEGPVLTPQPAKGHNVRGEVIGWCDHVLRLGHEDVSVEKLNARSNKGKATGQVGTRRVFTEKEAWFVAKNRMNGTLPAIVAFDRRDDDSIWQFLFNGVSAS